MWSWSGGGEYWKKLFLCYNIVYYYNGAYTYEQFLKVRRLYRALILLGLALCFPSASVSSVFMVLYIYINFFLLTVHPSLYLLVSWAWWDWPLTWSTNYRSSVLWHCWLGHLTRKIVPKMTYNVSSGTLNTTIPYHHAEVLAILCDDRLAAYPSANNIQTLCNHCLQVSTRGSSIFSDRNVCSGCCHQWPSLSSFSST